MLMFPPFHVQTKDITLNMGYAFILDPPKRGYVIASVNVGMLLVQWVGASLLTGLAFFMLKSSKNSSNNAYASHDFTKQQRQETSLDQTNSSPSRRHHPWRRFFARIFDNYTFALVVYAVFTFVLLLAVGATIPENVQGLVKLLANPIIAGLLVFPVWLPAEAGLLALFGATPGKWVFGIRVVHANGELLSFPESLKRSFLVWVQGEGLGFPIVNLLTYLFGYHRLMSTGTTLWDTSTNAVVTHRGWSVLRTVVGVVVVFAVLIMLGYLNSVSNQPHR